MVLEPVDRGFVLQLAKGSLSPQVRASICFCSAGRCRSAQLHSAGRSCDSTRYFLWIVSRYGYHRNYILVVLHGVAADGEYRSPERHASVVADGQGRRPWLRQQEEPGLPVRRYGDVCEGVLAEIAAVGRLPLVVTVLRRPSGDRAQLFRARSYARDRLPTTRARSPIKGDVK